MSNERTSIFDDDDITLPPLERLKGRGIPPRQEREEIKALSEERGFVSREQKPSDQRDNSTQPARPRRNLTGRNHQLNIKTTQSAVDQFYAIADANRWGLGETFEHALALLVQRQSERD